jgi:hypothetical protein
MRKLILAVTLCVLPRIAAAQQPAKFQLSLTPSTSGIEPINANGLTILTGSGNNNTETIFGLGAEFGILATPMVEPGLMMNLLVLSPGGNANTLTEFGFEPFLKLNFWAAPHVNPFVQPFAGFSIFSQGSSTTLFDGGLFVGLELLVTNWGFKLFSGFEALANGDGHEFGIPFRWAFTVYF